MNSWQIGPNALITGATKGIGYQLSVCFAEHHYNLVLVARHSESLEKLKEELETPYSILVKTLAVDLSVPSSAKSVFTSLQQENIPVDILVNNAGFGLLGPFTQIDLNKEIEMIQLNEIAPIILSKLFIKQLPPGRKGRILNVASTAAFIPGPYMAVYYASKAQLWSFSQALAYELSGKGITVTTLYPGPTLTEFQQRAGLHDIRLIRTPLMDAATVARLGFKALMKGKRTVVPGFLNKLSVLVMKLVPARWLLPIIKYIHS